MAEAQKITWTNERRKLSQLIPWQRNPRRLQDAQERRLGESLDEFSQVEPIAIGPGNEVYNGHGRLKAWAKTHGDIEIDVRVASRPLTEKEREKLTVFLHKGAAGEWDFTTLSAEFDAAELIEWGFKGYELGLAGDPVDFSDEWEGMPEFKSTDIDKNAIVCIVRFTRMEDLKAFEKEQGRKLTHKGKTYSMWYPAQDFNQLGHGLKFTDES